MFLLISYCLVNAAISVLLERSCRRFRLARVLHSAMFTVVLLFVLLAQDNELISSALSNILGASTFRILHESVIFGGVGILSSLMVIEITMPILIAAFVALFAARVVEYIRVCRSAGVFRRRSSVSRSTAGSARFGRSSRIYLLNCVMRC